MTMTLVTGRQPGRVALNIKPTSFPKRETNSHVLHSDVLEDLAVVDVPDGLVVPDLGGQQDGTQDDSLPVPRTDVDLRVGQESLHVDLHNDADKQA